MKEQNYECDKKALLLCHIGCLLAHSVVVGTIIQPSSISLYSKVVLHSCPLSRLFVMVLWNLIIGWRDKLINHILCDQCHLLSNNLVHTYIY